jgi:hypothetical protein
MRIELLNEKHDRGVFDCGNEALNQFLKKSARQQAGRNLSRTFVLTGDDPNSIIGYATLVSCDIAPIEVPIAWSRRYPHRIPAARLARLAVDHRHTRQGHCALLLVDMLRRVAEAGRHLGLVGLFVDTKDKGLTRWYAGFGFVRLSERPLMLFMALDSIEAAWKTEYAQVHDEGGAWDVATDGDLP